MRCISTCFYCSLSAVYCFSYITSVFRDLSSVIIAIALSSFKIIYSLAYSASSLTLRAYSASSLRFSFSNSKLSIIFWEYSASYYSYRVLPRSEDLARFEGRNGDDSSGLTFCEGATISDGLGFGACSLSPRFEYLCTTLDLERSKLLALMGYSSAEKVRSYGSVGLKQGSSLSVDVLLSFASQARSTFVTLIWELNSVCIYLSGSCKLFRDLAEALSEQRSE